MNLSIITLTALDLIIQILKPDVTVKLTWFSHPKLNLFLFHQDVNRKHICLIRAL